MPAIDLTRQVVLKAVDAETGKELGDVSFFVNGAKKATPYAARTGITYTFEAQKPGYNSDRATATVSAGSGAQQVVLPLRPLIQKVTIQVQFYPTIPGINWSLDGAGQVQKKGVSFKDGISEIDDLIPGSFTIAADHPEYEPKSQVLAVGDKRSFVVSLVRKSGGNTPSGAPAAASYDPNANPEDLVLGEDVSEETYNNSAYQGYFTAAQVMLYIGNLFIDQLHTIQYALQQNNIPLFGYCSEYPDAYGRGRSMIQGQLVLNYVHQGYLYSALRNYERLNSAKPVAAGRQLARAVKASAQASPQMQAQVAARLTDLLRSASPEDVQNAQDLLRPARAADPYANPVYRHTVFNMRLEVGSGPYRSVRMLESVKLGVNEQITDQSGQPLLESYAFIARRLR